MLNKIKNDLTEAMKSGEKTRIQALRNMMAALKDTQINNKLELSEDDIISVLSKQSKKIKESISQYKIGNRQDLVEKENIELMILNSYLPEPTSEKLIVKTIENAIVDNNASNMSDFGVIMGKVMALLPKNTDGKIVQKYVKEKLNI